MNNPFLREPGSADGSYVRTLAGVGSMNALLQRVYRWFHSFDEEDGPPKIVVKTPEDGARIGMVGWY